MTVACMAFLLAVHLHPVRAAENPIPVLAYYYIWFDPNSWNRAKTDYPVLGRYSSDDRNVMEQHVDWALEAGIDGFIVSWKSTDVLNPRLSQLAEVAREKDFKLFIIYQGLDFERDPLSNERISNDLEYFFQIYGQDPVFNYYGRPLVIWSGTWKFSEAEIEDVTAVHQDRMLILASERNREGYERLAHLVDGNAYYWSSVNPDTFPDYAGKLQGFSEAVHARGGLWIAPAAPGFDARLIGGTRVVERNQGETLRSQMDTALASIPDAIGLISWNEFSENTHLEPSEKYGTRYLEVLATFNEVSSPAFVFFDSGVSEAPEEGEVPGTGGNRVQFAAVSFVMAAALLGLVLIAARARGAGQGESAP